MEATTFWYQGAFRTAEGIERKKASDAKRRLAKKDEINERRRLHYQEKMQSDPSYKEYRRLKSKKAYDKNKTQINKKRWERDRLNKEVIYAKQRERYHRLKEAERRKIYANRRKRMPTRGLFKLLRSYSTGSVRISELLEQFRRAIDETGQIESRSKNSINGTS